MRSFGPKRTGEAVTLVFDFADQLPAGVTIASAEATTVITQRGTDAAPEALIVGAPAVSGAEVLQRVTGGAIGADYLVTARAILSDGQSREMPAVLPVRLVT